MFVNDFLTPQGSVDAPKVIHESIPRKPPMHEKCRFLGLFRPFEAVIHRLQRARSVSSPRLIPTFTTAVNTWQCDENDHLNVQFYTEFGHEASAHLLAELGLGPRAQSAAGLEVRTIVAESTRPPTCSASSASSAAPTAARPAVK